MKNNMCRFTHTQRERELKSNKPHKAFTLIELLIVIAIIGTLAGILFVSIGQGPLKKSRDARRLNDLDQLILAFNLHAVENGGYPSSGGNWRCLGHPEGAANCWVSNYTGLTSLNDALLKYMSKIPDDPKNNTACYGDAYLYNSNHPAIGGSPAGVYLHWGFEIGDLNDKSCGKGFYGGQWGDACGSHPYCWYYLGPGP